MYAGSFNPIHVGHIDIIRRAAKMFDELIVVIADNSEKYYKVSAEKRAELVENAIKSCFLENNITVKTLNNMSLAEMAHDLKVDVIVRGIRTAADIPFENMLAEANSLMDIETIYLPCKAVYTNHSSTLVRECIKYGLPLGKYVVPAMIPAVIKTYG